MRTTTVQKEKLLIQITSAEMVMYLATGRKVIDRDLAGLISETTTVYFSKVKKDNKEFILYCA